MAYAFEKMGVPAMLHSVVGRLDNHHAIRPGTPAGRDLLAYSAETLELVEQVRARGVPVVAVTIRSSVRSADGATLLSVSEVDFGAFRSLSATLCLAITLSVAVGTARQDG